eukprot:6182569-Pleurochrysis_carterae.AAC.1
MGSRVSWAVVVCAKLRSEAKAGGVTRASAMRASRKARVVVRQLRGPRRGSWLSWPPAAPRRRHCLPPLGACLPMPRSSVRGKPRPPWPATGRRRRG